MQHSTCKAKKINIEIEKKNQWKKQDKLTWKKQNKKTGKKKIT